MSLSEYRRKRRFERTREPAPAPVSRPAGRPIFVVQLHHARRRHYDVRLQVGDVLRSWAVPKGPSFDPAVRRLAVEVEDHPLDYATFEGEIPPGEYGGGHVAIFDRGVWTSEGDPAAQLAAGHLRFELFGEKLVGGWHLVRAARRGNGRRQWLLFKHEDGFAAPLEADDLVAAAAPEVTRDDARQRTSSRPARTRGSRTKQPSGWTSEALALPGARRAALADAPFAPQLATAAESPPAGPEWVHEIKWDGYRILVVAREGRVRLWSRNALDWTHKAPEAVAAVSALGLRSAAFDGELIAGGGRQGEFSALQATLAGERSAALSLVLFDLIHVDGVHVGDAPLLARKALLQRLLASPPPHLSYSAHVAIDGASALALADAQGFEGILSKRGDRSYSPGRSADWRKTKRLDSEELAVVGYTPPKGGRIGFGALLLARPDGRGGFAYAGRVGSGFTDEALRRLAARFRGRGGATPTVRVSSEEPGLVGAKWFEPACVVEVFHRGIGGRGLLRQPTLKGLRPDKTPRGLLADDAVPKRVASGTAAASPPEQELPMHDDVTAAGSKGVSAPGAIVPTHADRVVFADSGITKGDVFAYYSDMADWILPEIADRPLSVVRCPQGSEGGCFFQKHHATGLVRTDRVRIEEEDGDAQDYLVVREVDALLELVQFNAIEFHPWGARAVAPDLADGLVFDLDPGPGVPWSAVVDAARRIRRLLDGVGLASFARTSGGKGLHVAVPLSPGSDWALAKSFARAFADSLVASDPAAFVASASKRLRDGRIFVDYLRNGRGATSIASFSLRARPGAPVAMPLRWEELGRIAGAADYDLVSARRRMRRMRTHPWGDFRALRQSLDRTISRLP